MKAEYLIKVIVPPFVIFAILVGLTIAHIISGWLMYALWIAGFVIANLIVTRITARWSYRRRRELRMKEEKQTNNHENSQD